jgi:hypothetical protein
MLYIHCTIKAAQPEGANLAEQSQVGRRKIETMNGPLWDPIYECKAVGGTPFSILDKVIAPIALKVGDEVKVDQESGYVMLVEREGNPIYPPTAQAGGSTKGGKA